MASSIAPAPAPAPDGHGQVPGLAKTTIGGYVIERLHALGVDHVFGIPGDYILTLYKMLEESPIELVGMTREDSAGFAADAYARLRGLGPMPRSRRWSCSAGRRGCRSGTGTRSCTTR